MGMSVNIDLSIKIATPFIQSNTKGLFGLYNPNCTKIVFGLYNPNKGYFGEKKIGRASSTYGGKNNCLQLLD